MLMPYIGVVFDYFKCVATLKRSPCVFHAWPFIRAAHFLILGGCNINIKLNISLFSKAIAEAIEFKMENTEIDFEGMVNTEALEILNEIHDILDCKGADDFETVEKIVSVFEKHGLDGGLCHDFS